jgi:tyrosine-protein phosphatase SIW14
MSDSRQQGSRKWGGILLVAAVGAAVLGGVLGVSRRDIWPKNFGAVEEGKVYRSGQLTPAAFRKVVEGEGIRTVIDLGSYEPEERGDRRNQQMADAEGVTRYLFDLEGDATGNPNAYVQVLRLMLDPANQPVLVHCGAGSERTSCTMILYDHIVHGRSFEEGLKAAEEFKHSPRRNPHLRQVVEQYGEAIVRAVREGGSVEGAEELPEPKPVR